MCKCKTLIQKSLCSTGHPELLPEGYYYKDGYLFNSKNKRASKEDGIKIAKENWRNVLKEDLKNDALD